MEDQRVDISETGSGNRFPTINIVVAVGLLLLALVSLDLANRAGVEMTSHGTSTAGWLVQWMALALALAAIVLEVVAIVRAVICFAKYSGSRRLVNGFLVLFSIFVFASFVVLF